MKRKWIIIVLVVLAAGTAAYFLLWKSSGTQQKYQTAAITRGDLEATVTSTGTITAVGTVQVGTQVSGTVERVLVDFNDKVHRGQLLAQLDTRVLDAAVSDAHANVDRAEAQYAAALDQYNRNKPLFDKQYISAIEFNQYRSNFEAARAGVTSAKVALSRARTNLSYAAIYAPTDGTVIQRTVEPGQTVAASLSTPTLFTIAKDLSNMQIEVSVDEGDIGQIKDGQQAHFTVQSHPDKTFTGVVKQVRLQPQTVQNVVNYTVVVSTENEEGLLLPGMTATVNFRVNNVTGVLVVPNAALRFQPPPEVLEQMRSKAQAGGDSSTTGGARRGGRRDSGGASNAAGGGGSNASGGSNAAGGAAPAAGGGAAKAGRARLWTVDEAGNLKMIPVKVGLSDGQRTEVSGSGIHEGMAVVTGVALPQSSTSRTGSALPFGSPTGGRTTTGGGARSGGGGGGRGGF